MKLTSWIVGIAIALGVLSSPAMSQTVETPSDDLCAHAGETEILFSSKLTPDKLLVQVEGDNCVEPILSVQIHTHAGEIIYAVEMRAMDATYDCGSIEDCVEWAFDGALSNPGPWMTEKMPPLNEALEDEYFHIYDEDAYAFAHARQAPLYCYQSGKSGSDCLVYIDGKAVLAFYAGT